MKTNTQISRKRIIPNIIILGISAAVAIGILLFPNIKQELKPTDLSDYSSVSAICELATLKSFYHNVAVYEEEPGNAAKVVNVLLWPFYSKTGYKQFWIEYSGIVETGIDAGQIQINTPNSEGIVEVYVPDAKVLSVDADEESLSMPVTEEGLFAEISAKDQAEAYSAAQSSMRQEAENDQTMLLRAKNNAKLLLERYILNTGRDIGIDYSVKWIDKPR